MATLPLIAATVASFSLECGQDENSAQGVKLFISTIARRLCQPPQQHRVRTCWTLVKRHNHVSSRMP